MTRSTVVVVSNPELNHWRRYHLRVRVSNSLIDLLHPRDVMEEDDRDYFRERMGNVAWNLMVAIFHISGVKDLCFYTHTICVYCEDGVDWEILEPKVLAEICRVLGISNPEPMKVLSHDVSFMHYHPDDSAAPGFVMPQ